MRYLVLGAHGFIGSYLFHRMKSEGKNVVGTSRRPGFDSEKMLYFNIQDDNVSVLQDKFTDSEKTAIICIAQPNLDYCCEYRDKAYEINVIHTKRLVQSLLKEGYYVIFFSSDNVFDGKAGHYTEQSRTCAINEYGKMKAQMELFLSEYKQNVCIFRIPKVVSKDKKEQNVFTEWEKKVSEKKVYCIRGNIISFVSVEDIYQACLIASEKKLCGLYHICGDEHYSRKELAQKFYKHFGVTGMEIIECDAAYFPFKEIHRPLNVSMCNQKFKKETGYRFASMDEVIMDYRKENQHL